MNLHKDWSPRSLSPNSPRKPIKNRRKKGKIDGFLDDIRDFEKR